MDVDLDHVDNASALVEDVGEVAARSCVYWLATRADPREKTVVPKTWVSAQRGYVTCAFEHVNGRWRYVGPV